jgi:plasmid maintenance system killer protein
MPEKQQQAYLKTMHQRLQAINDAAHDKDMQYINKVKLKYGI